MMYAAFLFVCFLVFLLLFQESHGKTVAHSIEGLEHALAHTSTLLQKEQEKRQELDNKAVRLIEHYLDSQLADKDRQREREEREAREEELSEDITPYELKQAKIARKKLERCFGIANALASIPGGPMAEELQKLLGEVLLTGGEDDKEEIDAVYEGRFPGSVEGNHCSDCGNPGTPPWPALEEIKRPDGEHRLVHPNCEEAKTKAATTNARGNQ